MKVSTPFLKVIPLTMLLLAIGSGHAVLAQQIFIVSNTLVNLRSRPTTASDNVLATIPENTRVTAIQRRGAWYEVRLPDGREGWISQWLLTPDPSSVPAAVIRPADTTPQPQATTTATQPKNAASALPSPTQAGNLDDMIRIPAGTYIVGSSQSEIEQVSSQWNAKIDMFTDELERRQVTISEFLIDAHEVTNAEYYDFMEATRYPPPPHWTDGFYPAGTDTHPVTFITWDDAAAYAQWAGKRLPTNDEWEVASRGRAGNVFPWGASYSNQQVNLNYAQDGIAEVGSSRDDVSEFGVYDMGGNVMEWTMTQYGGDREFFVVKGGSWVSEPFVARGANQTPSHVDYRLDHLGFRCVKSQ